MSHFVKWLKALAGRWSGLEAEIEGIKDAQAKLTELHATPNGMEIHANLHPEFGSFFGHAMAEMVAKCENYTEMKFEPPLVEHGGKWDHITVLVKKGQGKTPHQLRLEAEAQRDEAVAALQKLFTKIKDAPDDWFSDECQGFDLAEAEAVINRLKNTKP